jgi:signal transduction histidine kinase
VIDHTAPIADPSGSRGPAIEAFSSDVFGRVLDAMDPSLQRYTDRLGPLVECGHAALLDWLADGEFSDEAAEHLGEVVWLAIDHVPLDVIDELEVAFIVTATEHFGQEARVIEGAKRVALCWYDGFWPFEHPAAAAQAVRFGMLANKIPAPVFMAGDDQRITFSSCELDALLGLHQGEIERFTMSELFATELNVGADEPTFIVTQIGGKIQHLTVTVIPTTTEVGTEYFGFVEDRTREVALEQMRDGVVAAISHELRTPLTAIIGYLELITSEALPPEDHESSLAIVKSESELLLRLVSDIVDFSKLTAGAAVLDRDRFLVRPEIEAAIRRVFPDTDRIPGVDVAEDIAIHFDRDRFGQLLTNLLTNARRYGGPNIEVSARREGAGIDLFVRDDGDGIPEAEIKTIFDPFVQGTRRHRGEGAGLGLAICAGIMQSAGGALSVRNDPGAVFRAYFPH